uniref:Uncharacterized protein n=1 Tax=Mycena chlorophos TaxID=658473 RepID=A0ABQ0L013_MYCCL|nr:predicted protein [Mycena chlorophos]
MRHCLTSESAHISPKTSQKDFLHPSSAFARAIPVSSALRHPTSTRFGSFPGPSLPAKSHVQLPPLTAIFAQATGKIRVWLRGSERVYKDKFSSALVAFVLAAVAVANPVPQDATPGACLANTIAEAKQVAATVAGISISSSLGALAPILPESQSLIKSLNACTSVYASAQATLQANPNECNNLYTQANGLADGKAVILTVANTLEAQAGVIIQIGGAVAKTATVDVLTSTKVAVDAFNAQVAKSCPNLKVQLGADTVTVDTAITGAIGLFK